MTEKSTTDHLIYQSNCSVGVLNTKSIKISHNNVIALLSGSGLSLMKSSNNSNEPIDYQHYKFNIPNPTSTYSHDLHKIINDNLDRFTTEQLQKVNLDHTLCPANNSTQYKGYRCLEWSFGECLNGEPLFALLSMEHELWIYKQNVNTFEPVFNVNAVLLNENCTKTRKHKYDFDYESLKELIYSVSIMKMLWTETVQCSIHPDDKREDASVSTSKRKRNLVKRKASTDTPHVDQTTQLDAECKQSPNFASLLIALSKSGVIYFFKINQTECEVNCTYLNEWQADLPIKDIYHFANYLVLVYSNGQVELIYYEIDNLHIMDKSNFDFANAIRQRLILWNEDDHIEVDDLLIYEHDSLINIVFTKTNFIILRVLETVQPTETVKRRRVSSSNARSPNESINKSPSKTRNNSSSSSSQLVVNHPKKLAIKHNSTVEGLFKMSTTGLCKLYNGDLLISSLDGIFTRIKIANDFTFKQEPFNFAGLINEQFCPKGLCSSADGYLCCSISYICVYFDHLEVRDSTQITIFTPVTRKEAFNRIIRLIETKDDSIEFKNSRSLFEIFRIYMIGDDRFDFDFRDSFQQKNLTDLSDLNLKVMRFVLLCEQASTSSKSRLDSNSLSNFNLNEEINDCKDDEGSNDEQSDRKPNKQKNKARKSLPKCKEESSGTNSKESAKQDDVLEDLIRDIEKVLSDRHFSKLKAKSNQKSPSKVKLNDQQQASMRLISNYLNKTKNTKEKCPICEESIQLTDRLTATCKNSHQFARCSYSLIPCDLIKYDYKLCSLCKRAAFIHPLIWSSSNSSTYCLYCC